MIPPFNASGVLPPYLGNTPATRAHQSPYQSSMLELAQRFGTSDKRRAILDGLLRYRADLKALGFVDGYQWIDGSFVENVEQVRGRPPGDVDVITVTYRPAGIDEDGFLDLIDENIGLFDREQTKENFSVDAFYIDLNVDAHLVCADAVYWSSLFSHQKDTYLWKGMLLIPLQSNDGEARGVLEEAADHA